MIRKNYWRTEFEVCKCRQELQLSCTSCMNKEKCDTIKKKGYNSLQEYYTITKELDEKGERKNAKRK